MFAASGGTDTSSDRDVTRPAMVRIWLVAAATLVVGILLGFATGFNAGRRAGESGAVGIASQNPPAPSPESGSTFSEGAVKEPVRVEPPPIVAEPLSESSGRVEGSEPRAQAEARESARRVERAPARPAPPADRAPAVDPVPVTGPGSLQVVSRPSGAQVILDGRSIGRTPLSIAGISDGTHDIRLDLPGFRGWATTVQVRPGEQTRVAASLEQ
jgi:hypothetical protein